MAQTIRIFLKYFEILGNGKEDTVHLGDKLEIILTSMTNTLCVLVLQYIIFCTLFVYIIWMLARGVVLLNVKEPLLDERVRQHSNWFWKWAVIWM